MERAFAHDWADCVAFGERHGLETLPTAAQPLALDLKALRDRALLLLGYAGAFRRSKLVALDVGSAVFESWAVRVDRGPQERSAEETPDEDPRLLEIVKY